jgi:hypothetical protein
MKTLNGTPEQVKFAEDCLVKFFASIEEIKAKTANYNDFLDAMSNQVSNISDASLIIKGYKANTDKGILPTNINDWKLALNANKENENIIIK